MRYELLDRDRQVVLLAGRLGTIDSTHIKRNIFHDVDRISMDRSLKRLTEMNMLVKVGRRASGRQVGAPPGVYQLGGRGWVVAGKQGRHQGRVTRVDHPLHVADLYTELIVLDREGKIKLEPSMDTEYSVGGGRADLFAEYVKGGYRYKYYFEVQMNDRKGEIEKHMKRYRDAYDSSGAQIFPVVVFVMWDEWHHYTVQRRIPKSERDLFKVWLGWEFVKNVN